MKKGLSILMTFLLLFGVVSVAKAGSFDKYRVFADSSELASGDNGLEIVIPVKISNNDGFMGFSVIVGYNPDVLTPVSAEKGSLLSGMFNDSIDTATGSTFKVLFSSSRNITGDGTLFTLRFRVEDKTIDEETITLSCIKEDTFDEDWNYIDFSCEDITLGMPYHSLQVVTTAEESSSSSGADTSSETETTSLTDESTSPTQTEINQTSSVRIAGFTAERTVDYKSTITFYALADNASDVQWYASGASGKMNADGSFTVTKATSSFSVYCTAKDSAGNLITGATETVKVKSDFISKIIAFFRNLFGALPVIEQR